MPIAPICFFTAAAVCVAGLLPVLEPLEGVFRELDVDDAWLEPEALPLLVIAPVPSGDALEETVDTEDVVRGEDVAR